MSNMSKRKTKEERVEFEPSASLLTTLKKHMLDWFENHRHEAFISPRAFQNSYSQFDKYTSESFRRHFYNVKTKILNGKIQIIDDFISFDFSFSHILQKSGL